MRRPFLAANWKMHGGLAFIEAFAGKWREAGPSSLVDVVICPPFAYLDRVISAVGIGTTRFGVQNVAVAPEGALTGEHAAEMAKDLGAAFAIVGHSERRRLFGETNADVADKFGAAQRAGLTPVLCLGETLAERRSGRAEATVLAQLDGVLQRFSAEALEDAVIAYEPVWAIGTGETPTPAQAQQMHGTIRARLARVGESVAQTVRVVYGGSVNVDNADALFAQADIDGGLVGGASLDAEAFGRICRAVAR